MIHTRAAPYPACRIERTFIDQNGDHNGKQKGILDNPSSGIFLLVPGISQLLGGSQLFFAKLIFTFKDQFALQSFLKAVLLIGFMILPTLCFGACFPPVGKITTRSVEQVGRSIGRAYMVNTVGALLGPICAGFVLIPLVGKESGLSVVVGLQLTACLLTAGVRPAKNKQGLLPFSGLAVPSSNGFNPFSCSHQSGRPSRSESTVPISTLTIRSGDV